MIWIEEILSLKKVYSQVSCGVTPLELDSHQFLIQMIGCNHYPIS